MSLVQPFQPGAAEKLQGLLGVLKHTAALFVHQPQLPLCIRVPECGCGFKDRGNCYVIWLIFFVLVGQHSVRFLVTLQNGQIPKQLCLVFVLIHTETVEEHDAKVVLSDGQPLIGSQAVLL
jgi:hypothetical protein